MMLMDYILQSLRIVVIIEMTNIVVIEERLSQLIQLEEDSFVVGYHQNVEKESQKVWDDRHIKNK